MNFMVRIMETWRLHMVYQQHYCRIVFLSRCKLLSERATSALCSLIYFMLYYCMQAVLSQTQLWLLVSISLHSFSMQDGYGILSQCLLGFIHACWGTNRVLVQIEFHYMLAVIYGVPGRCLEGLLSKRFV